MGVRQFRELSCWQLSHELKLRVYAFTAIGSVAVDRRYCDQVRSSARSAPSNIAEGFGRFRRADFARFLEIARGSLVETQNHVIDGRDLGYLPADECAALLHLANRACGATTALIRYLKGEKK